YFSQRWTVPAVANDAAGSALLHGHFIVGEGRYRVEWLMRDSDDRYCSGHFSLSASLRGKDRQIVLQQARGTVSAETVEAFDSEAPVIRDSPKPFKVAVLLHVVSKPAAAVDMPSPETSAILSILRNIAREPSISSYSVVAFNLDSRRVFYRKL